MVVQHNLLAHNAERIYGTTTGEKAKVTEKLSSGYKINRAADDAAGLSISEKMRRQIRGLSQGVQNAGDGISLCQVADGALHEVNDMLHRITELSVKAANGTYTETQRSYIQQEISEILLEIDRIGDATTFNDIPIFKGTDEILLNPDGTPAIKGDIDYKDFKLTDLSLGLTPFRASDNADHLNLVAVVNNPDLVANGSKFNLIFGNGSTSQSSVKLTYENNGAETQQIVNLESISPTNFQADGTNQKWSRDFNYTNGDGVDITITQTVQVNDTSATDKYYSIAYNFKNNGGNDVKLDFMFHADTAYNNNDRCEGYFVNGNRVNNVSVYANELPQANDGITSPYYHKATGAGDRLESFSIVDVDNALSFTEKITLTDSPDYVSVGRFSSIRDWSYYDPSRLATNLGGNTNGADLGFSLIWNQVSGDGSDYLKAGSQKSLGFTYGIAALETDANIQGVDVKKDMNPVTNHFPDLSLWIQSGGERDDGMWLEVGEMNTTVLGIKEIDVSTIEGAGTAMDAVKGALENILENRSRIGAQQNRLEHTIANEENIVENTTAAESRIRDADMATEMVNFSRYSIITQVGESMLAQANQSQQQVVALLQ